MLGEKLRHLRKERGLTQQELAEKVMVAPSTIGMYEQGRREPDTSTLSKLCQVLHVSVDYLLSESQEDADKDIEDVIAEIRQRLLTNGQLMFNGRPLSIEELEKIADTVELSIKVLALDKEANSEK